MRVTRKPIEVEATQWFKNGDHPEDNCKVLIAKKPTDGTAKDGLVESFLSEGEVVRYYRHPDVEGPTECNDCGRIMHEHGWIDCGDEGQVVCPGDWIVTSEPELYVAYKSDLFEKNFEIMDHPDNDLRKGCLQCETPHYGHFHCGTCGYQGSTTIEDINHPCYLPKEKNL